MYKPFCPAGFVFAVLVSGQLCLSQTAKPASTDSPATAKRGIALAKNGNCAEALPLLNKSAQHVTDKDMRLQAGLATVRCAMLSDNRDAAATALQWLNHEYPRDPEVLYVTTHAYSDLSTRAAQDLGRSAPESYQAHELNAESLEVQGKWDEARQEYEAVLKQNPATPGIHFRLGRMLLSKPNPDPQMAEAAKKEFEEELKIDPANGGAEYVLGELARQSQDWEAAIQHFSRAAKLDPTFGDAYLGLGQSLISTKKFFEAVGPLETAVKLEPQNPATHYSLATAYSRAGRKEDAEREFAIHRQMVQKETPQDAPQ
jgi:tetratricopeptide (TPR) repeat protein